MPWYLRILCGVLAIAVTLVAWKVNVTFYQGFAPDDDAKLVYLSFATFTAAIKLLFPAAIAYMPRETMRGVRVLGWFVVVAAVTFDVLGALGYSTMTRGATAGTHASKLSAYQDQTAEVKRLRALADEYADALATGEITAKLRKASANAGSCETWREKETKGCKAVADLEVQEARSIERDKREKAWGDASEVLAKLDKPAPGGADAQVEMFRGIAQKTGLPETFIQYVVGGVMVVVNEVVPPLGGFFALYGAPRVAVHSRAPPVHDPPPDQRHQIAGPPRRRSYKASRSGKTPDAVLDVLEELAAGKRVADGVTRRDDGALAAAQRALGAACGVSASELNRHLKTLATAGKIAVTVSPSGSIIEIK